MSITEKIGDRPSVSVVIPTYNYAKTLGSCLQAVLDQTYQPLEIVVVDDGSTDGSDEIAQRYPCSVVRTPNGGVSAARNLGAAMSSGDVIFFLDSDIALRKDALQRSVDLLVADPRVGFVCGVYDWTPLIDDGPVERYKVLHGHYWRVRSSGPVHAAFFSLGAIRREVFEAVGPLDEKLRATEDVEYGARVAQVSRIVLSADIVGRHDDDDRLSVLLRKQYQRSVPLIALFADRSRARPSLGETAYRPLAVMGACLALTGLPFAWWWPAAWAPIAAGAALFTMVEARLLGFAAGRGGLRWLPRFVALHALMNLTTGAAAATGALRWLSSQRFRRLYATPPPALKPLPSNGDVRG